jgi:hypothetical protein
MRRRDFMFQATNNQAVILSVEVTKEETAKSGMIALIRLNKHMMTFR